MAIESLLDWGISGRETTLNMKVTKIENCTLVPLNYVSEKQIRFVDVFSRENGHDDALLIAFDCVTFLIDFDFSRRRIRRRGNA